MNKDSPDQLTSYQARPVLSIVNDVRLGRRKACTFISDGNGNLTEIGTGMLIYQSKEVKEQEFITKKKVLQSIE